MKKPIENVIERKYNYWRGFAVASIVWGTVFILSAHYIIDKMA